MLLQSEKMLFIIAIFWRIHEIRSQVEFDFKRSSVFRDVLPTTDLNTMDGQYTLSGCAKSCGIHTHCSTFFYKPSTKTCILYKYYLWKFTATVQEMEMEVYEMKRCPMSDFVLFREGDICLKICSTTFRSSDYISTICGQFGGSLLSLDTDQKISFVRTFVLLNYGSGQMISIGLNNTAGWKWASGTPLQASPLIVNQINNYDANATPCLSDYCGILYVSTNVAVNIYDNCCTNTQTLFACSINI